MKALVWIVFALLLALWTGGLWATAEFTRWLAGVVGSGEATDWAVLASEWKVPAWLAFWVDPAVIKATLGAAAAALEALRGVLPFASSAVGWLVAVVWVVWGFGALLLLAVAFGFHLLVSRMLLPQPRPA